MITFEQLKKQFVITNIVNVRIPKGSAGQSVKLKINGIDTTATYLADLKTGSAIALLTDKGNWYLMGAAVSSQDTSTKRIIEYRKTTNLKKESVSFSVQILYFVWDAGYFNWYVGGDRLTPLLVKREPDEVTFPPTGPNSDRGVDYTEYELSNHSNLDKGDFRAIINTNFGDEFGDSPIVNLGAFKLIDGVWVADETQRVFYRKLSLNNTNPDLNADYDLVHAKNYDTVKGFRFLGNGYAFGSINLLRRYYERNFNLPGFTFDRYSEIPPEYACYLSYLEPLETGGSQEVIVGVDFSKDQYSYSLPVSAVNGVMPTKTPLTSYSGNLTTYTYEGEHYLMVGKDSYITEYIKKTSPTNIEREIRFYQNKKFVSNLNTNTAFTVSYDIDSNGGITLDYSNAIQLQRYNEGDSFNFFTDSNFLYLDFCQTLVGKTLTIASTHYETNEFWMSICTVNSVTTNENNAVVFGLTLTQSPYIVGYSSLLCGIGNFAPGAYQNGKYGVLYLESGSYFDLSICSLDIAPRSEGRLFDNNYLGAFNNTSEFHPFDPSNLAYLHDAILGNNVNYDIYYQENLYGNNLFGGQYPTNRKIERHLSNLIYLSNNFTRLHGNKIYRFQIIYKYPEGKVYGGLPEAVGESIQHPSAEEGYIRNIKGLDARATCYIEQWDIVAGNVRRKKKPLKSSVYGLYTEDIDWIFSDILDIDIGID
ncbi:MAG: hypothetical protein AB1861_04995 [Cyanobacteriota bacterium]